MSCEHIWLAQERVSKTMVVALNTFILSKESELRRHQSHHIADGVLDAPFTTHSERYARNEEVLNSILLSGAECAQFQLFRTIIRGVSIGFSLATSWFHYNMRYVIKKHDIELFEELLF